MIFSNVAFDWSPDPVKSPALPITFNNGNTQGQYAFTLRGINYVCGGQSGGGLFDTCSIYQTGSAALIPLPSATLPRSLSLGCLVMVLVPMMLFVMIYFSVFLILEDKRQDSLAAGG